MTIKMACSEYVSYRSSTLIVVHTHSSDKLMCTQTCTYNLTHTNLILVRDTFFQVFLSLYTGVHCRPASTAFKE